MPATNNKKAPNQADAADDVTVQSGKNSARTATETPWETKVIKLEFTSKSEIPLATVAHQAMTVLRAMGNSFESNIKLFTNRGKVLQSYKTTQPSEFADHFDAYSNKHTKRSNDKRRAWILFRIETKLSLKHIRTNQAVEGALSAADGRLTQHQWPENISNIKTIGFFVGPLPKYMITEEFNTTLSTILSKPGKRIPKFRCTMETITASPLNSQLRYRCQAFAIQVQDVDVKQMHHLLYRALENKNSSNLTFMPYSHRYEQADSFAKAVHMQAVLENGHRVVAIQGITADQMYTFERVLRKAFPLIKEVHKTQRTNRLNDSKQPIGRYNLLCNTNDFVTLARDLNERLLLVHEKFLMDTEITPSPDAEPTTVCSRFPSADRNSVWSGSQSSLTTKNSYLTALDEWLADYNPSESTIPTEVWETVPDPPDYKATKQARPTYAEMAAGPATIPPAPVTKPTKPATSFPSYGYHGAVVPMEDFRRLDQKFEALSEQHANDIRQLKDMISQLLSRPSSENPTVASPNRKIRRTSESAATTSRRDTSSQQEEDEGSMDHE